MSKPTSKPTPSVTPGAAEPASLSEAMATIQAERAAAGEPAIANGAELHALAAARYPTLQP